MNNLKNIQEFVNNIADGGLCVAFSGGVDSTLLLKIAVDTGKKVHAVMFNTQLHPCSEEAEARKIASEIGADITVMEIDEFSNPEILKNPVDRCYICKSMLFSKLKDFAQENGYHTIIDGTNADDHKEYRPGIKALSELGIVSPLAELGITKSEIRNYAKELGITVHNKPSAPCMATRFPYNTQLTRGMLEKVEIAENFLKGIGMKVCRLRIHGDMARIEVNESDFEVVIKNKDIIIKQFKILEFRYTTLDLEGFRSGSMDKGLV
ncbi:MAG: ATP-dependent sacrificial sulfur transferase LarE [Proteocatella sp.]